MGSMCLTDGTYGWPQGFAHYVEAHGVRPPEEFVRHVYATWLARVVQEGHT